MDINSLKGLPGEIDGGDFTAAVATDAVPCTRVEESAAVVMEGTGDDVDEHELHAGLRSEGEVVEAAKGIDKKEGGEGRKGHWGVKRG